MYLNVVDIQYCSWMHLILGKKKKWFNACCQWQVEEKMNATII
jgi:hypothetical protein